MFWSNFSCPHDPTRTSYFLNYHHNRFYPENFGYLSASRYLYFHTAPLKLLFTLFFLLSHNILFPKSLGIPFHFDMMLSWQFIVYFLNPYGSAFCFFTSNLNSYILNQMKVHRHQNIIVTLTF